MDKLKQEIPLGRIAALLTGLGDALVKEAKEKKNDHSKLDSSLIVYDSLISFSSRNKLLKHLSGTYKRKSKVYELLGNKDLAIENLKRASMIKDSIVTVEKEAKISELKIQYDVDLKEKEIALLQEQNVSQSLSLKNNFFLSLIIILAFVIAFLVLIIIYRRNKLRSRKLADELQQKLLRSQMNPHFIFNAINSIQKYVLLKDRQDAYNYLTKFSQLIRGVLQNAGDTVITLDKDLELLKLYVELEQLRFEESFDFEIELDPAVDIETIQVPVMLIQPFVENSIWHGIMPLERLRNGKIILKIKMEDGKLVITVFDNGIGRKRSETINKNGGHRSLGISLANQRLALISGEHSEVTIRDLYDEKGEPIGTEVKIVI